MRLIMFWEQIFKSLCSNGRNNPGEISFAPFFRRNFMQRSLRSAFTQLNTMPANPSPAARQHTTDFSLEEPSHRREDERSLTKVYIPFEDVQKEDVICGRNERPSSHAGNHWYNRLIHTHRERYQNQKTDKVEKGEIVRMIYDTIQESGGRFLKREAGTEELYLARYHEVRDKISHALRSARRPRPKDVPQKRKFVYKPFTKEEESAYQLLLREQEAYLREQMQADKRESVHTGCQSLLDGLMAASESTNNDTSSTAATDSDSSSTALPVTTTSSATNPAKGI